MRDYELTLIIALEVGEEEQKKLLTKIEKIISDLKGEVSKKTEWGKKEFFAPIKKRKMGNYFLWKLKLPQEKLREFNQKLKLEESILRYLLVKLEEKGGKNGAKIAQ